MQLEKMRKAVLSLKENIITTPTALIAMRVANHQRKNRGISVCVWHSLYHKANAWWDGADWVLETERKIPQGVLTHTMCPQCYEKTMEEVNERKRVLAHAKLVAKFAEKD